MAKKKRFTKVRRVFTRAKARAKKMTLPVALIGGFIPGVTLLAATAPTGWQNVGLTASRIYTGYDYASGKWNFGHTRPGLQPIIAGALIHKAASMLGINKAIAASGIPFFRI